MIRISKLCIVKQRNTERKLQFSEQQNVPGGISERYLGTLRVGSLHLIEAQDRLFESLLRCSKSKGCNLVNKSICLTTTISVIVLVDGWKSHVFRIQIRKSRCYP